MLGVAGAEPPGPDRRLRAVVVHARASPRPSQAEAGAACAGAERAACPGAGADDHAAAALRAAVDAQAAARPGAQAARPAARAQRARPAARAHRGAARLPARLMTRRPQQSVMANPVLVGATTLLVAIVAVFLAYQANEGLPFVPTRDLTVDLPNAQNLVRQNEVREGGQRIGLVTQLEPVRLPGGRIGARLSLKIDRDTPPVPVDSTWAVRP